MKEAEIARLSVEAMQGLLAKMPSREDKSEALSYLLMGSYKLLRTVESDEFVRGWLESALDEVRNNPPDVVLAVPH